MNKLKLPTLLSITDNPSVRFWIKKQLEEEFFIIDAPKRSAALIAAQTAALDFVIIDSEFEDYDAIELCRELKQILRALTPILLITGRLKRSFLDAAIEAGVTDFLNNQLDPNELQTRIDSIRKGHMLREKTHVASFSLGKQGGDFPTAALKSRVMLHHEALKMLDEAKQERAPVFALLIRIDQFSELKTAEPAISSLSQLFKKHLSQADLLIPSVEGRFLVLLRNANPEKAKALAEKIRKELPKTPFAGKNGPLHLTLSIVISFLEGNETDFNRMVDSSTKALKTAHDLIISIDKETL